MVLRRYKDTQRFGSESETFLIFSDFFFKKERERPNSRKQVWSNWYQVSSTQGTETAFLFSTGTWSPAMATLLNILTVACKTTGSAGPMLLQQLWNLYEAITSYQAKPIMQFDIRNLQVASSNKENIKCIYLFMYLTRRFPS